MYLAQISFGYIGHYANELVHSANFERRDLNIFTKMLCVIRGMVPINPKIPSGDGRGWDDEAYAAPSPRSDGYAHA